MSGETKTREEEMKRNPIEGLSLAVQEVIRMLDTAISLGAEQAADSGSKEAASSYTTEPKETSGVAKEKSPLEEKLLTGRKQVDSILVTNSSSFFSTSSPS